MYLLAVDGGSSKTDFCLVDESGRLHRRVLTEGCNLQQLGEKRFYHRIKEGLQALCAAEGITTEAIDAACLGVTAYGEAAGSAERIQDAVYRLLSPKQALCTGDMHVAWAGALGTRAGINAIAGTGAVAYGRDNSGNAARAGGWSCIFCDEGSAHWAARKTMQLFTKQADGRMPKTALYQLVRQHFALEDDLHFCGVMYTDLQKSARHTARLQLVLHQALQQGDEAALAVYREGAGELAAQVHAVYNRLHFGKGKAVPVSITGGMFQNEVYAKLFRSALGGGAFEFCAPIAPPVAGAALLAAQRAGLAVNTNDFLQRFTHSLAQKPE